MMSRHSVPSPYTLGWNLQGRALHLSELAPLWLAGAFRVPKGTQVLRVGHAHCSICSLPHPHLGLAKTSKQTALSSLVIMQEAEGSHVVPKQAGMPKPTLACCRPVDAHIPEAASVLLTASSEKAQEHNSHWKAAREQKLLTDLLETAQQTNAHIWEAVLELLTDRLGNAGRCTQLTCLR